MPSEPASSTAADARNEKILAAAEVLIGRLGYDRVRLIDVAEEADVSIGSLQHRFRSREGLLRAAVERVHDRERHRWLALAEGASDPWARLISMLEVVIRMDSDDGLWLELNAAARRTAGLRDLLQSQNEMWADALTQAAADGLATGRLSGPLDAADAGLALLGLIDGFYVARHTGSRHHDTDRITRIAKTVAGCIFQVHPADSAAGRTETAVTGRP